MPDHNHIEVLFEDNHLLVINKPTGILVQGDATGDEPLVEIGKRYIKEKYNKPGAVFLGVVHRLDRPVSGVVVFARTSKALTRMNALFKDRKTKKTYWAIVNQKGSRLIIFGPQRAVKMEGTDRAEDDQARSFEHSGGDLMAEYPARPPEQGQDKT